MAEVLPLLMGAGGSGGNVVGDVINQIFSLIRTVASYLLQFANRVVAWAGRHPLASLLFFTNFIIWVS